MALTLTLADYARIMPLATGAVAMEGTPLNVVTGRQGSWPDRASLLSRALNDPTVDAGEGSMGLHLARIGANLTVLSHAGLVTSRREGRSIIYAADYDRMSNLLGFLMEDCCNGDASICAPLAAIANRAACC